jgi:hypothetical protein
VLLAVALVVGLILAEIGTGYWFWRLESSTGVSALGRLVRSALNKETADGTDLGAMVTQYTPVSPFGPDPELGFRLEPGRYTVRVQETGTVRHHTFQLTIDAEGCRPASDRTVRDRTDPEIWLFGDSWVLGWGNDDASTLPWFLQRYLPDRRITSFANPGYGNLHALLQLRRLLQSRKAPETMVIAYADYFHERNAATTERLAGFRAHADAFHEPGREPAGFTHPRARRENGRLRIDSVPLLGVRPGMPPFPEPPVEPDPDPDLREQQAITLLILEEIRALCRTQGVRCVLAWLRGSNGDPVPEQARRAGYEIADLRPRADRGEWDDFRPFDPHPGPRAQAAFAAKLRQALEPPASPRSPD